MKRTISRIFVTICLLAGAIPAQESKMPQPKSEHKRLGYFIGDWTNEGDMKASPFGPGGKFTGTDHNEWFPGGFFVVLRSTGKSPMGPMNEMAVMGYNANEKVYTYDGFDNMGEHDVSKGTLKDGTWTWYSESKVEGKTMKGRFIIKELSPTSYSYKYDYSNDGKSWISAMEGKVVKK